MITVLYTTVDSLKDAKFLAQGLIRNKHAACVQIVPGIISMYEWEGSFQESQEFGLIIKTIPEKVTSIRAHLNKHHPYEVPCLLIGSLDVEERFQSWVLQNLASS